MIKTVYNRTRSKSFKMGRRRPAEPPAKLHFTAYRTAAPLPQPPAAMSYVTAANTALAEVYENDRYGDCVIAGVHHLVGVFTGNANPPPVIFTELQTLAWYAFFQGYRGSPIDLAAITAYLTDNDNGCDEATVLKAWQHGGTSGHKIVGWLAVDPTNPEEYRTALHLFENLFFGIELPDIWINPIPSASGFTWDVAGEPDPSNGHCIVGCGYNAKGVTIATWGMTGTLTDAAIAAYAADSAGGALYTVLSEETISKAMQKAPNGFNWEQLVADFKGLGGDVPAATPEPLLMSKQELYRLIFEANHLDHGNPNMTVVDMAKDIQSICLQVLAPAKNL